MPRLGFEPTTPVFEWTLDRATTAIGRNLRYYENKYEIHTVVYHTLALNCSKFFLPEKDSLERGRRVGETKALPP
jgi:hypothetical protein